MDQKRPVNIETVIQEVSFMNNEDNIMDSPESPISPDIFSPSVRRTSQLRHKSITLKEPQSPFMQLHQVPMTNQDQEINEESSMNKFRKRKGSTLEKAKSMSPKKHKSKNKQLINALQSQTLDIITTFKFNKDQLSREAIQQCEDILSNNPQLRDLFEQTEDPTHWNLVLEYLKKNPKVIERMISPSNKRSSNQQISEEIKEFPGISQDLSISDNQHNELLIQDQEIEIDEDKGYFRSKSSIEGDSMNRRASSRFQSQRQFSAQKLRQSNTTVSPNRKNRITQIEIQQYQRQQLEQLAKQQAEQKRLLDQQMLHDQMKKVYTENLNKIYSNQHNPNRFQNSVKVNLASYQNETNEVKDWSKFQRFLTDVIHGKSTKLKEEQEMLEAIDQFNRFIYMRGIEKTQLLRQLEKVTSNYNRHVINGFSDQDQQPNSWDQERGDGAKDKTDTLKNDQKCQNQEATQENGTKKPPHQPVYSLLQDLMVCKKLYKFRCSMTRIFQAFEEKDKQESLLLLQRLGSSKINSDLDQITRDLENRMAITRKKQKLKKQFDTETNLQGQPRGTLKLQ